ncbi:MAG: siphovirus Gp157 family protein [Butyrivibrio sp.]|jgi:hypothetical protein|nr:siphovirus Gp157 family protein [Butyrivibrio sp.]
MSTLYELQNEFLELLSMAEDPETDPQAFKDTLEGLEGEIEYKADGYAKVIRQLEASADAVDKEIKRLQGMKKLFENNVTSMKESLKNAMEVTGKRKFKTDLFSFNIKKNPASVVIDNEEAVPPEYLKVKTEVNKTAIKDAIKNGEAIEYAHLEQGESLIIG